MKLEEIGIPYTELGEKKEIELFWHISQSLVSKTYLDEILNLIVTMTANVMRSKICSLMLLVEEKEELKIAATQSLSSDYFNKPNVKLGESISGLAVKEKKPLTVKDINKDDRFGYPEIAKKEGIVSMISVPMVIGDRAIGVINSYTVVPHDFTDVEIKVMQIVANQAALAIENTKLRQENREFKRELEENRLIARAKVLLMEKDHLSEAEANGLLQKSSQEQGKSLMEMAQAICMAYSIKK